MPQIESINQNVRYTYAIMKPNVSQDFVNDLTVKTAEIERTVSSTSLSSPSKI